MSGQDDAAHAQGRSAVVEHLRVLADEASNDAFAARDADPREVDQPAEIPLRWWSPLTTFLGGEEPDDDDSADWIIRDVVPRGEPALLAGPPKSGKTWAALDIAIAVASGQSWAGAENTLGEPARVLAILLEDSERRIRRNLWRLARGRGLDPRDLAGMLAISREPYVLPDGTNALRRELERVRPALVITDNLTRVMVGNANETADAAAFGREWLECCRSSGAGMLQLHHTRKAGSAAGAQVGLVDRVRGSGDIVAMARNVVVMQSIQADARKVAAVEIRGNLDVRRPGFALELLEGETEGRKWARLVDAGDPETIQAEARQGSSGRRGGRASGASVQVLRRRLEALEFADRAGTVSLAGHMVNAKISKSTASDDLAKLRAAGLVLHRGDESEPGALTELGRAVLAAVDRLGALAKALGGGVG